MLTARSMILIARRCVYPVEPEPFESRCIDFLPRHLLEKSTQGANDDQVARCCLCARARNICAGYASRAASTGGWNDNPGSFRMRPRSDPRRRPLRGENHHPAYPPSHPQKRSGILKTNAGRTCLRRRKIAGALVPALNDRRPRAFGFLRSCRVSPVCSFSRKSGSPVWRTRIERSRASKRVEEHGSADVTRRSSACAARNQKAENLHGDSLHDRHRWKARLPWEL